MAEAGIGFSRQGSFGFGAGPLGARVDPLAQGLHFGRGEPGAGGGHDELGVGAGDVANQQAVFTISRHDSRDAAFAAVQGIGAAVEAQVAFVQGGAVAAPAAAGQNGPDVHCKIRCRATGSTQEDPDEPHHGENSITPAGRGSGRPLRAFHR